MNISTAEMSALLAGITSHEPTMPEDAPKGTDLLCRVCGTRLDEFLAPIGTHPLCDEVMDPSTPKPPSTLPALRGALMEQELARPRSTQVALGPSEIAVECDRRLGYSLRGAPSLDDGRLPWPAIIGTAVHAVIADSFIAENAAIGHERWLVEQRVWPDPSISGSTDAYDTENEMVIDWKVVGTTSLKRYISKGPGAQYEGQIQLYGLGWQRAGRVPKWVRIVFLPRATGFDDAYEWTAPYSRVAAEAVMERMYATSNLLQDLDVTNNPSLWGAVPASPSRMCVWCPYFRRDRAADESGCPGDVKAYAKSDAKFTEGLIA